MGRRWTAEEEAAERRRREDEATLIRLELARRVEDLAPVLLPDGVKMRGEWRQGARGSKSILLTGPQRGVYRNFETSDKGTDLIGAIAELVTGGSMRAAFDWARAYLGINGASDEALAKAKAEGEKRRLQSEKEKREKADRHQKIASSAWHQARPILDTPADDYLKGRGIDLRRLPKVPGALRYSDEVWCAERKGKFPAMLAGLWRIGEPKIAALHRTYLAETGGRWDKAALTAPRSTLAEWPGALVPLQRGANGRRWTDIEEGEDIAVGEGVEEGLSISLVKPDWRVGAVGYVGNFGQIQLPVWCHLKLCVNNDAEGSPAWKELFGDDDPKNFKAGAVADLEAQGHVVRVLRPPPDFKDWNDLLRGIKRG